MDNSQWKYRMFYTITSPEGISGVISCSANDIVLEDGKLKILGVLLDRETGIYLPHWSENSVNSVSDLNIEDWQPENQEWKDRIRRAALSSNKVAEFREASRKQQEEFAQQRIAKAEKWIQENLSRADSVKTRYSHFQIRNIIEHEIGYVSNDDVLKALENLGYDLRVIIGSQACNTNIPTEQISAWASYLDARHLYVIDSEEVAEAVDKLNKVMGKVVKNLEK